MKRLKKIKPMFNRLVLTFNTYKEDQIENGLITHASGELEEYQTVIAVGDTVRGIKEGDLVCFNPLRYAKMKHQEGSLKDGVITDNMVVGYNFNVITIDGEMCLVAYDQDIDYVVEDFEEVPNSVIVDEKPKIII